MSEIIKEGKQVIVKPQKDIVATMVAEFKEELRQIITTGETVLTIDLSGVEMMDSMGIGVLIAAHNSLNKKDGCLKIQHADENILKLLKNMRLDKHFDII